LIYGIHGLALSSEVELPLPAVTDRSPDGIIRVGPVDRDGLVRRSPGYRSTLNTEAFRMEWDGIGAFHVSDGREILIDPAPGTETAALLPLLLGSALAVLMHQRGRLVLHASAVLDALGNALLILGHSGQGKSTLAAACRREGLSLLSDDLAPLEFRNGRAHLHPGPGWMKLWPETLESVLGVDAEPQPRIRPEGEKRLYFLPEPGLVASVPVGNVVVLQDVEQLQVEPICGADAVAELTRYSFCGRLLGRNDGPRHLKQCVLLAHQARLFRLQRPRDLGRLEEVAHRLLQAITVVEEAPR
jgi:hypothetical protein